MTKSEMSKDSNKNAMEAYARSKAAALFHRQPEDLTPERKQEILFTFIKEELGQAWLRHRHNHAADNVFLSFEYSFGKPGLRTEAALGLGEKIETLCRAMGTNHEEMLALEEVPYFGYGSLGRFSAAWMEEASNRNAVWMGYGLRYRSGFYQQEVIHSRITEKAVPPTVRLPWEIETDVCYTVDFREGPIQARAWDWPIASEDGSNLRYVRLWDAEDSNEVDRIQFRDGEYVKAYRAATEARRLVEFLYPENSNESGRKLRFMQEVFFASATAQDLLHRLQPDPQESRDCPQRILINETHPLLTVVEVFRLLTEEYGFRSEAALRYMHDLFCYVNHVLSDEVFESWSVSLIEEVYPPMVPAIRALDAWAKKAEGVGILDENTLKMHRLATVFCRRLFAFSDTHAARLSVKLELEPPRAVRTLQPMIPALQRAKQYNPVMFDALEKGTMTAEQAAEEKIRRKERFAERLRRTYTLTMNPRSVFISTIANFHENNRQLMSILTIAALHERLMKNPHWDIPEMTWFFSGRAYTGYLMATEVLELLASYAKWLTRDVLIRKKLRIAFLENADIELERELLYASDIYQALRYPEQATALTNAHEAVLNGAAVLSSEHGDSRTLWDSIDVHGSPLLFEESGGDKEAAWRGLRFLEEHRSDLGFDVGIIRNLMERYRDGFHVLSAWPSYHRAIAHLFMAYRDDEQWDEQRATAQIRLFQSLKQRRETSPCRGQ